MSRLSKEDVAKELGPAPGPLRSKFSELFEAVYFVLVYVFHFC